MECVPKSGYIRHEGEVWRLPAARGMGRADSSGRREPGPRQQRRVPDGPGGNPGARTTTTTQPTPTGSPRPVYGVNPPLANALRPPGQFQSYDIVFRHPIYKDDQVVDPGSVTVFSTASSCKTTPALEGPTGHMARSKPGPFPEAGPLKFRTTATPSASAISGIARCPRTPSKAAPMATLRRGDLGQAQEIAATVREDAAKAAATR